MVAMILDLSASGELVPVGSASTITTSRGTTTSTSSCTNPVNETIYDPGTGLRVLRLAAIGQASRRPLQSNAVSQGSPGSVTLLRNGVEDVDDATGVIISELNAHPGVVDGPADAVPTIVTVANFIDRCDTARRRSLVPKAWSIHRDARDARALGGLSEEKPTIKFKSVYLGAILMRSVVRRIAATDPLSLSENSPVSFPGNAPTQGRG